MRISCLLLALALAAGSLVGCGGESDAETAAEHLEAPQGVRHLKLTLPGWEGPESAGILMADERGHFADVGLDVEILSALTPALPVVDEADDLGVARLPQVVLAKEKGAPIVVVGSLVQRPTAAMIWPRKSKIRDLADLKGKTIAIQNSPYLEAFLQALLVGVGLSLADVEVKRVRHQLVPELTYGRVDAIFGSWNVEGADLEFRALEPLVITTVQDLGVPAYDEFVVIARTDRASKDPGLIRDFMSALARGTAAAARDPEDVVDALEEADETNPETSLEAVKAQVEATLPLLSGSGYVSPERTRRLVDWMYEQGMIRRKPPVASLLTNRYR